MEPKQRFKAIRERYGLSMRGFGERLGLTASSVSSIEYGTRALGDKHIKLICAAFPEISEDWLRTGEGDMLLPKPESSLPAELTDDPMIRAILEAYLDLDPQARQMFRKYFADVVARYKGEQPASTPDVIVDHARATEPPDSFVHSKRIPVIQGTHEAEIQMQYQAKQEQRELAQSETLQSDSP